MADINIEAFPLITGLDDNDTLVISSKDGFSMRIKVSLVKNIIGGSSSDLEVVSNSSADFDLVDGSGGILCRFSGGDFKTKNFNSATIMSDVTTLINGISGISEAPKDGSVYGRCNGAWVKITATSGSGISGPSSSTDGKYYVYKNGAWVEMPTTTTQAKTLRILSIGNSFSADAFSYVPSIVEHIDSSVNLTFGIAFIGGGTLADQYSYINNNTANYYYYKYLKSTSKWAETSGKSMTTILADVEWDIIIFQQQSSNSQTYSTYQPYLNNIISLLGAKVTKSVKLGFLLTPALPTGSSGLGGQTSDAMFASIASAAQSVLNNTAVEFILPEGTAIQNARTTDLDAIGTSHLTSDSLHLQEGLPCQIAAYVTVQWILDYLGTGKGIYGDNLLADAAFVTAKNIPNQQGTSVGSTAANCLIAQKCALAAIKKPYAITTVNY